MFIKIEVDIDPPMGFETEAKYLLNPIPFSINTYKIPYLFAGKMHAILCRKWKTRIKGRDWYDLVWYIRNDFSLNLMHLENRMKQSGHFMQENTLDIKKFMELIIRQIDSIDFEKAKQDVLPFLRNKSGNPRFFKSGMRANLLLILLIICYMLFSNRVGHIRIKACGENNRCTAS